MALGGMFGNRRNPFAIPGQDAPDWGVPMPGGVGQPDLTQVDAAPAAPATGFNKPGGLADKLGQVGDVLLATSGNPGAALLAKQQNQGNDLKEWLFKQQYEQAHPKPVEDPSVIRTLRALGLDPTSPEGRRVGIDSLTRPFMVGSPEGGFTGVGGSFGTGGPQTKVIGGTTYYNVNGDWYDNPEGK